MLPDGFKSKLTENAPRRKNMEHKVEAVSKLLSEGETQLKAPLLGAQRR